MRLCRASLSGVVQLALVASSLAALGCQDTSPEPSIGESQAPATVCSGMTTTFGIDVSRYQGTIDWSQVAGADVEFAYIQISRKIDDIDAMFETNWQGAKAVGILRGAYQRFQPDEDVIGQADIFLAKLGAFEEGDLPPMLDVEDSGGLGADAIAMKVRQWLEYVEAELGVRPIIYTGRYFWQDTLNSADFTEYPLWIAHYTTGCPTIPEPWTDWALHQYSSQAVLPGITENTVDVNHFNGSTEDLLALAAWRRCGNDTCDPEESSESCVEDCPPVAPQIDAGTSASDAGEDVEVDETPPGEGGGCALAGNGRTSPGTWFWLMSLSALAWRRRRGRRCDSEAR